MSEPTLSIGAFLKQVRLSKGLTLRQAAAIVGITHSRVDEVERMIDGRSLKAFTPSYVTVVKFAKAYVLPVDQLLQLAGYEPGIELEREEWEVVNGFRALSSAHRLQLIETLHSLLREESPPYGASPPPESQE